MAGESQEQAPDAARPQEDSSTGAARRWLELCARMDEMCGGPGWRDRVVGGYRLGDGWQEFGLMHDPEKPPPVSSEGYGLYQINDSPRLHSAGRVYHKGLLAHALAVAAKRGLLDRYDWTGVEYKPWNYGPYDFPPIQAIADLTADDCEGMGV